MTRHKISSKFLSIEKVEKIINRKQKIELSQEAIDAVPTDWKDALDMFEETLKHEQVVTSLINDLFAMATKQKDYATQRMQKWFIDEQVEEEENARTLIDSLKMINGNGYGLYMLDKELTARVYSTPSPLAAEE